MDASSKRRDTFFEIRSSVFKECFFPENEIQYSPLNSIYYSLVYRINRCDPFFFHLFSLIGHLVNIFLVYYVVKLVLLILFVIVLGRCATNNFTARARFTFIALAIAPIVFFIVFPHYSTSLANLIGIKRGVDVFLYFGFLALIFTVIRLYTKIRLLDRQLTEIVRQMAIQKGAEK